MNVMYIKHEQLLSIFMTGADQLLRDSSNNTNKSVTRYSNLLICTAMTVKLSLFMWP